jgi:hypothetical protein
VPDSKLDLLHDSVTSVLRALSTMPSSREVRALADRALRCERAIALWDQQPPTPAEREATMQNVLALHMALAKLQ